MTEAVSLQRSEVAATPFTSGKWLPALMLLFVGSGCAALIYEIVWLQMLQLQVGASAVSMGILLGTFMGGMCIGSLLFPRLVSNRFHPLRVYAVMELSIGLIALLEIVCIPWVSDLYVHFATTGMFSIVLRGIFAGICLLPPTILMGATLPAIARWVETTRNGVSWLGFFYGGNILGAVIGTLIAGWVLPLKAFDMQASSQVGAAINASVAILALLISFVTKYKPAATSSKTAASEAPRDPEAWMIYLTIGVSGLTGIGAEVVWTRLLSLTEGASTYTFTNILAVFLIGLGIGSTVGAFMSRSVESPRQALGWCQLGLVGSVAWAAYAITYMLPFWPINPYYAAVTPWYMFQLDLARTFWTVLPGAVLWGASFPLALAAVSRKGQDPGKLVGGVYAANTVGAILGAFLFSMIIPYCLNNWGSQGMQRLLILLSMFSSLLAFSAALAKTRQPDEAPRSPVGPMLGVAAALIVSILLAIGISPPNWVSVAYGRNSASWIPKSYPAILSKDQINLLKLVNSWGARLRLQGDDFVTEVWNADPNIKAWDAEKAKTALNQDDLNTLANPNNHELLVDALKKGKQMRPALADDVYTSRSFLGTWDGSAPADGAYPPECYCAYVGEGMNVTVAVTMDTSGYTYFHGAGKVQASSNPEDMHLQRTLGHITALTCKNPENVLVVACGAGVTAGSFVPYDSVKKITICDIEPLVPHNVSETFFDKENHSVIKDKRTEIHIDDGRHFIKTSKEKYDVITSDPIDPWVKGCAALNTVEYYQSCKDHLNPGGVMALWIPLYESSEQTSMSVISTFFKVFPHGVLWSNESGGKGYDAVLYGTAADNPAPINIDQMQAYIDSHPKVKDSLRYVGYGQMRGDQIPGSEAVEMLATYAANGTDLAPWWKGHEDVINYDRNLRLQYIAGLWINQNMSDDIFRNILHWYKFPKDYFTADPGSDSMVTLDLILKEHGRIEQPPPATTPK